jgi:mono/diheme cytochrome c family protein
MPTVIIFFFEHRHGKFEMNLSGTMILVALLLVGCSRQIAAQRDAIESAKPGYLVAKSYCSQCHSLPFPDQHPPAAWPYVVSRMQNYIESAHRRMPDPAERKAIIGYFESN